MESSTIKKKVQQLKNKEIMKTVFSASVKMMAMAAMMVMGISASAKDIDTTPFDKVQIDTEARVRIIDGDKYSVNVRSTDQALAEDVRVNVENGTLAITSVNGSLPEGETMIITITCPTDLDVATSYCYEALEVEQDVNAMEVAAEPAMPDFRHMPFRFVPAGHGRMPHHMPMMHRPWGRA